MIYIFFFLSIIYISLCGYSKLFKVYFLRNNENYLTKDQNNFPILPTLISFNTFPNPFNLSCNIEFLLPQSQKLKIQVVNVLGNQVRILNDSILIEGNYRF